MNTMILLPNTPFLNDIYDQNYYPKTQQIYSLDEINTPPKRHNNVCSNTHFIVEIINK